jgi:hypothetical protein
MWQVCLTRAKSPPAHGNQPELLTLYSGSWLGSFEMLQLDPWIKAAECERVIRVIADPERRSVLMSLQGLWVALGNDRATLDRLKQASPVPRIAQIHVELMALYKNAMN